MTRPIRSFIAIELPETVRQALDRVRRDLSGHDLGFRWTRPENVHLTVKFLGDVEPERLPGVIRAMERAAAAVAPLSLSCQGLGVFPTIKKPRILWAGVTGDVARLAAFVQDLEAALEECGFEPEGRRFAAHLTIGRAKRPAPPPKVSRALETCGGFSPVCFDVSRVVLFQSDLRPDGPVYTRQAEVAFGGTP